MPQTLDDLRKVAPARDEVDDQLVGRWNRVAEVWRDRPDFRQAVLRYATTAAWRDPASAELWPEVVYPLIERARWQRELRSSPRRLWDNVCAGSSTCPTPASGSTGRSARSSRSQVVEKLDALARRPSRTTPSSTSTLGRRATEPEPTRLGVRIGRQQPPRAGRRPSPEKGHRPPGRPRPRSA